MVVYLAQGERMANNQYLSNTCAISASLMARADGAALCQPLLRLHTGLSSNDRLDTRLFYPYLPPLELNDNQLSP